MLGRVHAFWKRRQSAWLVAVAAVAAIGGGCSFQGNCSDVRPIAVRLPSGASSTALVKVAEGSSTVVFPHGAIGPLLAGDAEGGGGAEGRGGVAGAAGASVSPAQLWGDVIPSARLQVDRESGTVTRSYIDEQGRKVVELYRIGPTS